MKIINIAKDFSEFPAGRYKKEGPQSGEQFRNDFLIPAIKSGDHIKIILDGTEGYGSSFLEEAFGGLVRAGHDPKSLRQIIVLESSDKELCNEIWEYVNQART